MYQQNGKLANGATLLGVLAIGGAPAPHPPAGYACAALFSSSMMAVTSSSILLVSLCFS